MRLKETNDTCFESRARLALNDRKPARELASTRERPGAPTDQLNHIQIYRRGCGQVAACRTQNHRGVVLRALMMRRIRTLPFGVTRAWCRRKSLRSRS